jgi:S1-C subfamily serine protease
MKSLFTSLKAKAIALPLLSLALVVVIAAASPLESIGAAFARTVSKTATQIALKTNIAQPASQTALAAPEAYEQAVIDTTAQSLKAVVAIVATKNVPIVGQCTQRNGGITFLIPCQQGTQSRDVGGGSGFFVRSDGLILTNKHVVDDAAASYTVFTPDGKRYPAVVKRIDSVEDLAILQIKSDGFPVLPLGDSDAVRLGQTAIAIGNALGEFNNSVSVGVISGINRSVTASGGNGREEKLSNMIQTDTAINPGNSGGPLLNLKGQVIGITTAVASNAQSIGFGLPSNRAKAIIAGIK